MKKAYWIAHGDVSDMTQYKRYADRVPAILDEFGGKVLARGGASEQLEGQGRARNVVVEFPSLDRARACYHSAAYQEARAFRLNAGTVDVVIVEGI